VIYLAKVVDVHPEQNSVDVVLAGDGRRFPGVAVMSWALSGNTGVVDLPVPDLTVLRTEDEKWKSLNTEKRDIQAVVAIIEDSPVCLGFIAPPACELNFPKEMGEELRIDRHASDVYSTLDRYGNAEWYHPSGTCVRIAEDLDHVDLTGKDFDRIWKLRRNLARKPGLKLVIANTDGVRVTLMMTPTGSVSLEATGDITLHAGGRVVIDADKIDLNGQVKINGVTQVDD
jgi:hypothetical protein